jgi:hypothetical protein
VASVTPPPTPQATATPEATPEPTPVVVTVEVTPDACLDAIDWMLNDGAANYELISSLYGDYLDYPDEDLAEFGARVEQRLTDFQIDDVGFEDAMDAVTACREAS